MVKKFQRSVYGLGPLLLYDHCRMMIDGPTLLFLCFNLFSVVLQDPWYDFDIEANILLFVDTLDGKCSKSEQCWSL